jgi:hypothetical protein
MGKLFAVTDKKGNPVAFGNSNKSTWKSPHWVNYHIGPSKYGSMTGRSLDRAEKYDVHIIDFTRGTVQKTSAVAFLATHQNPEIIKVETMKMFGFALDIPTLETMVRANALSNQYMPAAMQYLNSKGINI